MVAQGLAQNGARVYLGGRREALLQRVADQFASQGLNSGQIMPFVRSLAWP